MSKRQNRKKRKSIGLVIQLLLIGGIWLFLFTGKGIVEYYAILFVALITIPIVIIIVKAIKKQKKRKQYLNSPLPEIDKMTGIEFEEFLKAHFEEIGYKAKMTPTTNDYGADLILNKDGEKIVVQAKRWNDKVGNTAVQEIVSAKGYYKADRAMVITNSYYTNNAYELAKANNVELWDRNNLIKNLNVPRMNG